MSIYSSKRKHRRASRSQIGKEKIVKCLSCKLCVASKLSIEKSELHWLISAVHMPSCQRLHDLASCRNLSGLAHSTSALGRI